MARDTRNKCFEEDGATLAFISIHPFLQFNCWGGYVYCCVGALLGSSMTLARRRVALLVCALLFAVASAHRTGLSQAQKEWVAKVQPMVWGGSWDTLRTSLMVAASVGDLETYREVLKTVPPLQRDEAQKVPDETLLLEHVIIPPVHEAAYRGHRNVLEESERLGTDLFREADIKRLILMAFAKHVVRNDLLELIRARLTISGNAFDAAVIGAQHDIVNDIIDSIGDKINLQLYEPHEQIAETENDRAYPVRYHSLLHSAVLSGDIEMVKSMLDLGFNINSPFLGEQNVTAAHLAMRMGQKEMLRMLIARGGELDRSRGGFGPLLLATKMGRTDMIEVLIHEAGVSIEASEDNRHDRSIHIAAVRGDWRMLEELLKYSPDIDAQNKFGQTALHMASMKKYGRIVHMLLDAGADPNIETRDGETAATLAAEAGSTHILEALAEKGANIQAKNAKGLHAMAKAALKGHLDIMIALHNLGFPIDELIDVSGRPRTTFDHCLGRCEPKVVQALLELGADPHAIEKRLGQHNAMTSSTVNDKPRVMKILHQAGFDPNAAPAQSGNRPPILWATKAESARPLRLLLTWGVDVNVANENGNTALILATQAEDERKVELLLEYHADPNIANELGRTPLLTAITHNSFKIVDLLLANGADPDMGRSDGDTPLVLAVRLDLKDIVELLIRGGASLSETNEIGQTALAVAILENRDEIVYKLLLASEVQKAEQIGEACWEAGWDSSGAYLRKTVGSI